MGFHVLVDLEEDQLFLEFVARYTKQRLVSYAMYGLAGDPLYVAIWEDSKDHDAQDLWAGDDFAHLQSDIFPLQASRGFHPVAISGTAHGQFSDPRAAVMFEKSAAVPTGIPAVIGADAPHLTHAGGVIHSDAALHVIDVDLLEWNSVRHVIALVRHKSAYRPPFGCTFALAGEGGQWETSATTIATRRGWVRPQRVIPTHWYQNQVGFQALWRSDAFAPWPADLHPSTAWDMGCTTLCVPMAWVEDAIAYNLCEGRAPLSVGANGLGANALACIVFRPANQPQPLPRRHIVVDQRDESPPVWVPPLRINEKLPLSSTIVPMPIGPAPQKPIPTSKTIPGDGTIGVGPPHRYSELDEFIFETVMAPEDVPGVQVAAAIDGRLVINRSYTRAQEGYPIVQPRALFRVGSISKALTGMAAIHCFALGGETGGLTGLGLPIQFGLGSVHPANADLLNSTTVDHILRHRAGWFNEPSEELVAEYVRGGVLPALPGDTLEFLRVYDNVPRPLYVSAPGAPPGEYQGVTIRALAEAISKRFGNDDGVASLYEPRMQTWWKLLPSQARYLRLGQLQSLDGEAPAHCYLAYAEEMHIPHVRRPMTVPVAYSGSHWGGPAGGWAMSAATLVRILSGMQPGAAVQPLLNPAETKLLYEVATDPGAKSTQGRIFIVKVSKTARGSDPRVRILHNGASSGCSAIASFHCLRDAGPSVGGESLAVAILQNQDTSVGGLFEDTLDPLERIVRRIERYFSFGNEDLFPSQY